MSSLDSRFADLEHTVDVTHVTTTVTELGDGSTVKTTETISGVLFAPEGLREQVGSDEAAVVGDATLYGHLSRLDADDTVVHAASCCDGSDFAHGTWQVVGGTRGWGRGDKAAPIRRTGAV